MPQASAVSASRAMSMTARPVTALSVEREASSRIETARSRASLRLARQTRSEPRPEARRSTWARTAASRSRSSPSGCCGSTTRRGRSASKRRRTARMRRAAAGSGGDGGRRLGLGGEHPAVVGQPGAGLVVPFRIEVGAGQPLAVDVGGREVEMQLEPGGRRLRDLAEADLVEVVGGLAGAVGVVVVDAAVEVQELGPGEQRLELEEDQAVAALDLVGLAPPGPVRAAAAFLARRRAAPRRPRPAPPGRAAGGSSAGQSGTGRKLR